MEFEFDPAKDDENLRKHGLSLRAGVEVILSAVVAVPDARREYSETRINAIGYISGRAFVCTHTMRDAVCRIISVRPASRRERRAWLS